MQSCLLEPESMFTPQVIFDIWHFQSNVVFLWYFYDVLERFIENTGIDTKKKKTPQSWEKDKLTSCCWFACPARHSCNFRAAYQSEATGPCRNRRHSPRQSSHLTDPGPRRSYCASAEQSHTHTELNTESKQSKMTQDMQEIQYHRLEFTSLQFQHTRLYSESTLLLHIMLERKGGNLS